MEIRTFPIWYFKPGTEERQEVVRMRTGQLIVRCAKCTALIALGLQHSLQIGPDGALTTEQGFSCPSCGKWSAQIVGGVVKEMSL
jgi:uncharacterized Zn finger protein